MDQAIQHQLFAKCMQVSSHILSIFLTTFVVLNLAILMVRDLTTYVVLDLTILMVRGSIEKPRQKFPDYDDYHFVFKHQNSLPKINVFSQQTLGRAQNERGKPPLTASSLYFIKSMPFYFISAL